MQRSNEYLKVNRKATLGKKIVQQHFGQSLLTQRSTLKKMSLLSPCSRPVLKLQSFPSKIKQADNTLSQTCNVFLQILCGHCSHRAECRFRTFFFVRGFFRDSLLIFALSQSRILIFGFIYISFHHEKVIMFPLKSYFVWHQKK